MFQKMKGGASHRDVRSECFKLGGSGGMLPWENFEKLV